MRRLAILTGLAAVLALCGCAATQSGLVWKVDSWDRTVAIGDAVYRVTDDTKLYGPDGGRIWLDDLPTVSDPTVGVRRLARAEVDFLSREDGGELTLDALWVRHR